MAGLISGFISGVLSVIKYKKKRLINIIIISNT
jgi:hypothetical protein